VGLALDVFEETTNLVERTHDAVVARSVRRFAPIEPAKTTAEIVTTVQTAISGTVFFSLRSAGAVARLGLDRVADLAESQLPASSESAVLEPSTPMDSTALGSPSWLLDYAEASVNGFYGDYLTRRKSPLDLGMTLRHHGRRLSTTRAALSNAYPDATPKICVFVHGLACTEWMWSLRSEEHYGAPDITFGKRLHDDFGYTPIYVRYNSGRHISENGQLLSEHLTKLLTAYPVPIEEISLVGHSMGGLVARSAAHYANEQRAPWLKHLRRVACIGAPNLGAPLEKAVNVFAGLMKKIDAAGAQVPAALLNARSAGVKDLRYGYTVDEEWTGRDPDAVFEDARRNVPLVDGVGYYFVGATITRDTAHPVGALIGDLLVRLPSATGHHPEPTRRIHFESGAVFAGMNHIHLANHPDVYDALRAFFASSPD
jgi:pimeloyl-ACP methyl ester carboxylesterase